MGSRSMEKVPPLEAAHKLPSTLPLPAHVLPTRREVRLPDLHQPELPSGHMADRTGCGI